MTTTHAQSARKDTEQRQRLAALARSVDTMDLVELHSLWKHVFGHRSFTRSKVYLRRMLTYRFDELRKSGSGPQIRGAIRSLTLRAVHADARRAAASPIARDPRLPPPGTVLRREHGGRRHNVVVWESGCEYQGARYGSLSAVAVKISGGQVNGFAFFSRALREASHRSRLTCG